MTLTDRYHSDGYAIVRECLSADTVRRMIECTETARMQSDARESVSNSSGVFALRNLVDVLPEVAELITIPEVNRLVTEILGADSFLIRSTLFDKTDGANWGVFWHQDLSIAVRERHAVPGYHSWTKKAGVHCVQPPTEIMSQILAVRLHLDHCTRENGALKVLPGTHRGSRLSEESIEQVTANSSEICCEVPVGGAVLMNPLLLHSSEPMQKSGHRRVIHLEFAAIELPPPLEWRYRVPCFPPNSLSP